MKVLLDRTFARTLDALVTTYAQPMYRGARLDAWLFEDAEARRAAEARFAEHGVSARLHSAYKPLLHAFLEDIALDGLQAVTLVYPRHADAVPNRFLLESYPLQSMFPQIAWTVRAGELAGEGGDLRYHLSLRYADGREEQREVRAPNVRSVDHIGMAQVSPTGWLCVRDAGVADIDQACPTEVEGAFQAIVQTVQQHAWGKDEPYFQQLDIQVDMPGMEFPLDYDLEHVSTAEGMHEDIYFALLEVFQHLSGRPVGNRGLQSGQIVPDIRLVDGDAHVRMVLRDFAAQPPADAPAMHPANAALHTLAAAPTPARIDLEFGRISGERFMSSSRQGRPVNGLYRPGTGTAVLISAGQHANETSGVVGALRAVQQLDQRADAHFAYLPVENPDGYAMHQRLCQQQATHMHHATRYTALGDDLAYREQAPWFEAGARREALQRSGAELHVNLHGYPAHEWTRPWSGYLPRKFEMWTIPKGFFLVLRHQPGWADKTRRLLEGVTARLAQVPGLVDFNARQIAAFELHAGALGFEIMHGIPYTISESGNEPAPISLITEFPDETIYGDDFVFAHTAQMETVLAAVDVYASL